MIVSIYVDDNLLYSSKYSSDDATVIQPQMKLEMGKAGAVNFTILPGHYLYNQLHEMTSIVTVYFDDLEMFRGRISKVEDDFYKNRKVTCESNLAFLLDSIVFKSKSTETPRQFFEYCLQCHNSELEDYKALLPGSVTIDKANEADLFEVSKAQQTSSVMESELLNVYGGFFVTRYDENSGNTYLDYLKSYPSSNTQPIRFAWNMISMERTRDAKDLYTVLMPTGKDDITIESANSGSPFLIVSESLVAEHGIIIKEHSFSGESTAESLKAKAQQYISDNQFGLDDTFKIKALDMSFLNGSVDMIKVGSKVNIVSPPHNLDIVKDCISISYNFEEPGQNEYEFGVPPENKEQKERRSSHTASSGISSSVAKATEKAVETSTKKIYDAYIKADPEAGTVTLYGLYNKYEGDVVTLKNEVGIDLNAQAGSVIVYSRTTEGGQTVNTHFGVLKDQIESKVSNSTYQTYVTQTATTLSSLAQTIGTVPDGQNLYSLYEQEANKIGMVVGTRDGSNYIKAGDIALEINKEGSTAYINANRIGIGSSTYLDSVIQISNNNVQIFGDYSTWDEVYTRVLNVGGHGNPAESADINISGGVAVFDSDNQAIFNGSAAFNGSSTFAGTLYFSSGQTQYSITASEFGNVIKSASVSGNTLTLTPVYGSPINFSKATSLSGAWSSGTLTVTADVQGVPPYVSNHYLSFDGDGQHSDFSVVLSSQDTGEQTPTNRATLRGYMVLISDGRHSRVVVGPNSSGANPIGSLSVGSVYTDGETAGYTQGSIDSYAEGWFDALNSVRLVPDSDQTISSSKKVSVEAYSSPDDTTYIELNSIILTPSGGTHDLTCFTTAARSNQTWTSSRSAGGVSKSGLYEYGYINFTIKCGSTLQNFHIAVNP